MSNVVQGWAPVAAATAASISAIAALITAIKTSKAADSARSALAFTLRPIFAIGIGGTGEHKEGYTSVRVSNTGAFDATDVAMTLADESGQVIDTRAVNRMRGQQPGVWAPEDKVQTLFAPTSHVEISAEGTRKRKLSVTVRYTDDHGIQRWEQRIEYVWELTRIGERDELRKYPILGEPRKIN